MGKKLKIKPEYFQAIIDGRKPFEIRENNRNFESGDEVTLREYEGLKCYDKCLKCDCCPVKNELDAEGCFSEEDAIDICGQERHSCHGYEEEVYTGRSCIVRIKDIFDIGFLLADYVAFTFDLIQVNKKF